MSSSSYDREIAVHAAMAPGRSRTEAEAYLDAATTSQERPMNACTDTHAHGGGNPACPDLHRTFCACGGTDEACATTPHLPDPQRPGLTHTKLAKTRPYRDLGARARAAHHNAVGIPASSVAFRATLTATSNSYLVDRLPLDGLVLIHERDVVGGCQFVTFMPDPVEGGTTSFVAVPDAVFTFHTNR